MQINVNAVAANVERQQVILTKDPSQPIQCFVMITTDAPPPNDRITVAFPLADAPGGPTVASLIALRDYAKTLKGL